VKRFLFITEQGSVYQSDSITDYDHRVFAKIVDTKEGSYLDLLRSKQEWQILKEV